MVMPANQTNELVHLWSALYGGVGHLYTPARKERIRPWLPYALDNGRYAEVDNNLPFDEVGFVAFIDGFAVREIRPMWLAVPDVPFDGAATIEWWNKWALILVMHDIPLALCVQDGMTPEDVDALEIQPEVIFLGGSTEWKWKTVPMWADYCKRTGKRLHVGRVNTQIPAKLEWLAGLGVESIDGSGWFRGKGPQVVTLGRFLAKQAGQCPDYAERCALATRYAHRDQYSLVPMLEATA